VVSNVVSEVGNIIVDFFTVFPETAKLLAGLAPLGSLIRLIQIFVSLPLGWCYLGRPERCLSRGVMAVV